MAEVAEMAILSTWSLLPFLPFLPHILSINPTFSNAVFENLTLVILSGY